MNTTAAVPTPTVVCVMGMHRSGTSVVSRLLNLLGVYLGPPRAISNVGDDNPKGYWEHHPIALLNDDILIRYGGTWDRPPVFPDGWSRSPELADLKDKARGVLADFAGQALWGWKDPRTCLTLPFWQELVGPIRYAMAFRNPGEVIASLQRRNGMNAEQAERLWLTYVQSSLTHTSDHRRMFVFYDDIMNNCATELARLADFVGRADALQDPAVSKGVADFLESTLRHHRLSMESLAGDERISFPAKSLYLAVRGLAPRQTSREPSGGRDRAPVSIHKTLDALGARAVEEWDRSVAAATERDALMRVNREQADAIAQLNATVAQLTASVAQLTLEGERLAAQAREQAVVTRTLGEIQGSAAWTLVTRVRNVIVRLFPPGTGRRRAVDVVLRRIAPGQPPEPPHAAGDSLTI
jgi:hypothetical protein